MAGDDFALSKRVNAAILAYLPADGKVLDVVELGLSEWCDITRYDVRVPDGSIQRFFEKRAKGPQAHRMIKGQWESETTFHRFIPEYLPRPVACGTYQSSPDLHFFLMEFVDMFEAKISSREHYVEPIAALHLRSMGKSPNNMFGFHVETWFGNLPYSNAWETSWEAWWTKHMRFVVEREEKARGPRTEEESQLVETFLAVVLPRYLRPLATDGRSVQPTLCHGDLWPGNLKHRKDNGLPIIYDACAAWCHNEAPLQNPRYPLGKPYIQEYWKHVPISEPRQDVDSRILMYLVRNQVQLASLYPNEDGLRDTYLNNMEILITQVPDEESEVAVAKDQKPDGVA